MRKTKLEELSKGDLLSIKYRFNFIQVGVYGNNGEVITWARVDYGSWFEKSEPYSKIEEYEWSHIGTFKKGWFKNKSKIELF